MTREITAEDLEAREDLFEGGKVAVSDRLLPDSEYESISMGESD